MTWNFYNILNNIIGIYVCRSTKSLQLLQNNTAHGRKMKPSELGIRDNIVVPDGTAMAAIAETLSTMEKNTSAMRKLELLLEAVKLTYDNVSKDSISTSS